MINSLHYIMIHTQMWAVGELRGQILPVDPDLAFIRGDCDGDDILNTLTDTLFLLAFGFLQGPQPLCLDAADVDNDGVVNALVDGLALLTFGFLMGDPPPAPFPDCGHDTEADSLQCVASAGCP